MHVVQAKGILSPKNGMNLYRGCTHGCIYCDSRSLCYSMDHDFEDVEVKENAPFLLEKALASKRKKCMIGTGAMCDPYMTMEKELKLTRRCTELILRYGFGLSVLTKSDLILRDLDLLKAINEKTKCVVQMTLTTFDEDLCKIIEPNVATTARRAEVLQIMAENNIPTVVWLSPILPFINDSEENLRGILDYCIEAKVKGIMCFGMGMTLRDGDREYFYEALDRDFPGMKGRYQQRYGYAYHLSSPKGRQLMEIFRRTCREHHIMWRTNDVFQYLQEFPEEKEGEQMSLFSY